MHKEIFPLSVREILGSGLLMLLLGIANVWGSGGSFIASPILITLFNFEPLSAIRITYCMVFGGAIGSFINIAPTRLRKTLKPAINYDVAIICIPLLMSGASLGTLVNSYLSAIAAMTLLAFICIISYVRLWSRAKTQHQEENAPIPMSLLNSIQVDETSRNVITDNESHSRESKKHEGLLFSL